MHFCLFSRFAIQILHHCFHVLCQCTSVCFQGLLSRFYTTVFTCSVNALLSVFKVCYPDSTPLFSRAVSMHFCLFSRFAIQIHHHCFHVQCQCTSVCFQGLLSRFYTTVFTCSVNALLSVFKVCYPDSSPLFSRAVSMHFCLFSRFAIQIHHHCFHVQCQCTSVCFQGLLSRFITTVFTCSVNALLSVFKVCYPDSTPLFSRAVSMHFCLFSRFAIQILHHCFHVLCECTSVCFQGLLSRFYTTVFTCSVNALLSVFKVCYPDSTPLFSRAV